MRTTKLAGLTALSLVLFACGSDEADGTSNTTGATVGAAVLVKGSPSPADATCPGGGTKIEVGSDKNGNGQLDADEVTGSQVVCNPGAAPTLTTVTPTGPSAKCTQGGQTVKSGPDTNANGKLDDGEVTTTEEICTGGTNAELASTTVIPEGDPRCPFGGKSTDVGYDNGANNSIAGDGVLQSGEVLGTVVTCAGLGNALIPPSGAPGASKIVATGGTGLSGAGGPGNNVVIGALSDGLGGGDIKIWKTGTLAVDIQVPVEAPAFGTTKLDVTQNLTIQSRASSGVATDGEYYSINGSGLFYRQNAGNAQVTVTGVHVAPNVTLTFPGSMNFTLSDDFHNEGTITTVLAGNNRGSMGMTVGRFIGAAGSKIALAGQASAASAGGTGGNILLQADKILNQGTIDTSGAAGDANGAYAGGTAGVVQLSAARTTSSGPLYQTGDVKAVGGAGKTTGGSGGSVQLTTNTKGIYLKGNLDQYGGSGTTGGNGNVFIVQALAGGFHFSGTRKAYGGDVDEAACGNGACQGGAGGTSQVVALGGDAAWSGDNLAYGGKGKGAAGGTGGGDTVYTQDYQDPVLFTPRAGGAVRIAGTRDTHGGDGVNGGQAGGITFGVITSNPAQQTIELFGFASIESNGGNGASQGGTAGPIVLLNRWTSGNRPTGSLVVYPNLSAKGGMASNAGSGGAGGQVQMQAGVSNQGFETKSQALLVQGTIDTSGGNGLTGGGPAGPLDIQSRERVDLNGLVLAKGGSASGNGATAGASQGFSGRSGTSFTLSAPLTMGGGAGTGTGTAGGACTKITILSGAVKATGAIECKGGVGTGAGGASNGIELASSQAPTSYATLTATGGNGSPQGANGTVTVDGNAL